jgi:hypothetical protein
MAIQIPFPLPASGYALNSKLRINLDFIVEQFNKFNTGTATWDNVSVGSPNNLTGTITFYNSSNTNYVSFKAGATSPSHTYTLPLALPGTSGSLHVSSAGVMTWEQSLKTTDSPTFNTLTLSSLAVSSPPFATFSGTTNRVTVTGSAGPTYTFSTPQDLHTGAAVTFANCDATNGGVFGVLRTGTGSLLSVAVAGNADALTGINWPGSSVIQFVAGGVAGPIVKHEAISGLYTQLQVPSTVAAIPSISVTGDPYTGFGFYNAGAAVAITVGQNPRVIASSTGVELVGTISVQAGSTFTSPTVTGSSSISTPSAILTAGGFQTTLKSGATANFDLTLPVDFGLVNKVLASAGDGTTFWADVTAVGGASNALDNLSSVAINTSLISDADNTDDLGSSAIAWKDIFLKGALKSGATTLATVTELGYLTGVSSAIQTQLNGKASTALSNLASVAINTSLISDTDNTDDLGSTTYGWRRLYINDGAVGTPSITFKDDTDTGLYRIGANNLGIACNGAKVVDVGTTGVGVTGALTVSGAASAASASVTGDVSATSYNSSFLAGRNRIINGDMRWDQRREGATAYTVNASSIPTLDCIRGEAPASAGVFTVQRTTSSLPIGATHAAILTTTTPAATPSAGHDYQLRLSLEGNTVNDFLLGTENAKTFTLSFWVRSSLTGTFGIGLVNNGWNRSYVAQYTITTANTWEYKTITVPGDVTGTWTLGTVAGLRIHFDLGSGTNMEGTANAWQAANKTRAATNVSLLATNGATLYLTNVQLELGTNATAFEHLSDAEGLRRVNRYVYKTYAPGTALGTSTDDGVIWITGLGNTTAILRWINLRFPAMRAAPTMTGYTSTGTSGSWRIVNGDTTVAADGTFTPAEITAHSARLSITSITGSPLTVNLPYSGYGHYFATAEL